MKDKIKIIRDIRNILLEHSDVQRTLAAAKFIADYFETLTEKPEKPSGICGQCGGKEFKHAPGIGDYCVKCGFDGQLPYKPGHFCYAPMQVKPKPEKLTKKEIEKIIDDLPIKPKNPPKISTKIERLQPLDPSMAIFEDVVDNRIAINTLIDRHNDSK